MVLRYTSELQCDTVLELGIACCLISTCLISPAASYITLQKPLYNNSLKDQTHIDLRELEGT